MTKSKAIRLYCEALERVYEAAREAYAHLDPTDDDLRGQIVINMGKAAKSLIEIENDKLKKVN